MLIQVERAGMMYFIDVLGEPNDMRARKIAFIAVCKRPHSSQEELMAYTINISTATTVIDPKLARKLMGEPE